MKEFTTYVGLRRCRAWLALIPACAVLAGGCRGDEAAEAATDTEPAAVKLWVRSEVETAWPRDEVPRLISPVAGVRPDELEDTYGHPRHGDRRHRGIDIHAPRGTPVVAVLDGWVVTLREGGAGGRALHLADRSGRYLLYYAHLERVADGVWAGRAVRQGDVLGYVGTTGNAPASSPHLHFEVGMVSDVERWWDFRHVNPYLFLTGGLGPDG